MYLIALFIFIVFTAKTIWDIVVKQNEKQAFIDIVVLVISGSILMGG